ncbi:MAG: Gfo/Idh/MocA family oxidoreductase [Armatimonadetes bacterium]|nr:Gfo/Idh/MocA family oxidoreductase [Armatimonadota bacterium]
MTVYRVGVIGAGMMGKTHAWCWQSIPFFYGASEFRCVLTGVATSRMESARAACEAYGYRKAYDSALAMIEDPEIDIIDIASPNKFHREALLSAHRAGKPVYCDKPLTGSLEAARDIERAIPEPEKAGQMVFHNRFFPATLRARQMIESGDLGEIICFRGAYLHSGNALPGKRMNWKDRRDYGGGTLYDLGSHLIDLVTWLCGSGFQELQARQKTLYPLRPSLEDPSILAEQDSDDMTLITGSLKNGAIGTLEASKIATGAQDEIRFEIHGTKGALRYNLMEPNYLDYYNIADPEAPLGGTSGFKRIHCIRRYPAPADFPAPKSTIGWLRGHLHCLYNFIESHHRYRTFDPSIARGIELEKALDAAARSARNGAKVSL